jgi:hypothetical protein
VRGRGEARGDRPGGEQQQAGHQDPAVPVQVAEPPGDRRDDGPGQHERRERPGHLRGGDVELVPQHGQRGDDDRLREARGERGGQQRRDHPPPFRPSGHRIRLSDRY